MNPELQHYLNLIDDLRSQVHALIADLPAEALNWRPVEGTDDHATNSLAVLAAHVAGAEHYWLGEVIGGLPATRNRAAEFTLKTTTAAELIYRLDEVGGQSRQVLAVLSPTDLDGVREAQGRPVSVRWAILHVIDHTALHLGHMQLTYQLWMGGQSTPSPRWFERLSGGERK
ncbi:MAG: DinB family protein [Anaerolineae bacterium]